MDPNEVYNLSLDFSQKIRVIVQGWPAFAKETNGRQIVRSADSVSATLK
jgi:peptide methionine sulfoxide reductase MsrB